MAGYVMWSGLTLFTASAWSYLRGDSSAEYSFRKFTSSETLSTSDESGIQKIATATTGFFSTVQDELVNTYTSFRYLRATLDSSALSRPLAHLFQIGAALGVTFVGYKIVTKVAFPVLAGLKSIFFGFSSSTNNTPTFLTKESDERKKSLENNMQSLKETLEKTNLQEERSAPNLSKKEENPLN